MSRILVIEGDGPARENLELLLGLEGFLVASARDGRSGLEYARRLHPALILCDAAVPGVDGLGVLRELRGNAETADIPLIFLADRDGRVDLRTAMNEGADDFFRKPVVVTELVAAIRARLRRRREQLLSRGGGAEHSPDFRSAVPLERLGLTPREAEVLFWVAHGKSNSGVAAILRLSEKTVKIHLGHVFNKLLVETRTEAALCAIEALSRSTDLTVPPARSTVTGGEGGSRYDQRAP